MSRGLNAQLEALLGELAAEAGGEHPDGGRLLAYHEGRLPAADEEAVQAHLASCPACAAVLLDLDAFTAAVAERDETAPVELATRTAWKALAPHLAEGREEPARRGSGRGLSPPWLRAAAAALLLAVPVLAWLLVRSQQQLHELRARLAAPQAEVAILYLDSTTRDEGLDPAVLVLPEGEEVFLLAVTPDTPAPSYRVEVRGEAGQVIWRHDHVAPSDHGTLRLGFTRRSLPPGRYRLEVTGPDAGPPAVFSFVLRDPS